MNIYWATIKKYKNKMTIPEHSHKFHQILFIKNGVYEFLINEETFIINKTTLIGIPSNFRHSYRCIEQGSILDFKININNQDDIDFNKFFIEALENSFDLMILDQLYVNMLNNLYNKNQEVILIKALDLVLTLLREKNNDVPILSVNVLTDNDMLTNVIHYFELNFLNNPKIIDIANYFNLSIHEMDKLFMTEVGVSPKKLLLNIRLEYAREKLTTDKSITYIANEIDMSLQHFSRIFKYTYGLSPKQYQKNYKNNNSQIVFNSEFDISVEPKIMIK
ncbi:transcriptional regulator [Weissella koreensis KACC 15510]|uniref:AraC family transcriptional regulator n=1 Tax=Weissella koreensis TaxID=165096 RepID=UPI00021756E7|nr:AraC family transcriptional regulator [Weissella koreensis]AEJ22908.1 transcriptional regulator [Weissella koreensis KACC 15510]